MLGKNHTCHWRQPILALKITLTKWFRTIFLRSPFDTDLLLVGCFLSHCYQQPLWEAQPRGQHHSVLHGLQGQSRRQLCKMQQSPGWTGNETKLKQTTRPFPAKSGALGPPTNTFMRLETPNCFFTRPQTRKQSVLASSQNNPWQRPVSAGKFSCVLASIRSTAKSSL